MADSTDGPIRREWQESGGNGHLQAVVDTARMRADQAWRAYITHTTEQCQSTCRFEGVDCSKAVELKAAWNAAKADA
ncbi:hypothetical protein OG875_04595 [Streptomyces sp. NBC_01498]|uniref:hypothetical protein n=1 Tax=Streptomyces sp. NBC_01498 TaxID=2975870 RepID=UPI002E7AEB6C|nr:hypothetical protein [Streptomyces sp. NBC_01498]WTL23934.1 hypothetical protein OG875_04595 [Streptomyces sp. NBC_01498]